MVGEFVLHREFGVVVRIYDGTNIQLGVEIEIQNPTVGTTPVRRIIQIVKRHGIYAYLRVEGLTPDRYRGPLVKVGSISRKNT